VYALIGAFQKVLRSVAQEKPHVVGEVVVPIEEKIEELKRILTEKGEIHFEVLMVQQPSRLSLIVAFLAVLEMVRQRFVRIFQEKPFGSILICLN
jgi:segregation and condensation protein A